MLEVVPVKHICWAPAATDPSKLRSVLLHPEHYKSLRLYEQHIHSSTARSERLQQQACSSYALTIENLPDGDGDIRCTVYGNLGHSQPDYAHAAQQITQQQPEACRFSALPNAAVQHTRQMFEASAYQESYFNPCYQYVLAGTQAGHLQQRCCQMAQQLAAQYELSTLQQQDAALVDGLWTFRSPGSQAMVEQLIAERLNTCVRSSSTGAPVSWVLEVEPGCAGMLHTVASHRREGLGRWAFASLLCKLQEQHQQQEEQLQRHQQQDDVAGSAYSSECGSYSSAAGVAGRPWPGGHVYCYVVQENTASIQLMESLGLTNTGTYVWMGFRKQ